MIINILLFLVLFMILLIYSVVKSCQNAGEICSIRIALPDHLSSEEKYDYVVVEIISLIGDARILSIRVDTGYDLTEVDSIHSYTHAKAVVVDYIKKNNPSNEQPNTIQSDPTVNQEKAISQSTGK